MSAIGTSKYTKPTASMIIAVTTGKALSTLFSATATFVHLTYTAPSIKIARLVQMHA